MSFPYLSCLIRLVVVLDVGMLFDAVHNASCIGGGFSIRCTVCLSSQGSFGCCVYHYLLFFMLCSAETRDCLRDSLGSGRDCVNALIRIYIDDLHVNAFCVA